MSSEISIYQKAEGNIIIDVRLEEGVLDSRATIRKFAHSTSANPFYLSHIIIQIYLDFCTFDKTDFYD